MEENIITIEELNATIAVLTEENQKLKDQIAALEEEAEFHKDSINKHKADAELMRSWWVEAKDDNERIKGCMNAIATLIDALK